MSRLWASKLRSLLKSKDASARDHLLVSTSLSADDILAVRFINDRVLAALHHLKYGKSDSTDLGSDHFVHAAPVIVDLLASLFTALVRHGYVPSPSGIVPSYPFQMVRSILLSVTITVQLPLPPPSARLLNGPYYYSILISSAQVACSLVL